MIGPGKLEMFIIEPVEAMAARLRPAHRQLASLAVLGRNAHSWCKSVNRHQVGAILRARKLPALAALAQFARLRRAVVDLAEI
jgi:hypothetical protein